MAESRGLALTSAGKDVQVDEALAVPSAAAAPTRVTTSRRGRWIDYSLAEDAPRRLNDALPAGTAQVSP